MTLSVLDLLGPSSSAATSAAVAQGEDLVEQDSQFANAVLQTAASRGAANDSQKTVEHSFIASLQIVGRSGDVLQQYSDEEALLMQQAVDSADLAYPVMEDIAGVDDMLVPQATIISARTTVLEEQIADEESLDENMLEAQADGFAAGQEAQENTQQDVVEDTSLDTLDSLLAQDQINASSDIQEGVWQPVDKGADEVDVIQATVQQVNNSSVANAANNNSGYLTAGRSATAANNVGAEQQVAQNIQQVAANEKAAASSYQGEKAGYTTAISSLKAQEGEVPASHKELKKADGTHTTTSKVPPTQANAHPTDLSFKKISPNEIAALKQNNTLQPQLEPLPWLVNTKNVVSDTLASQGSNTQNSSQTLQSIPVFSEQFDHTVRAQDTARHQAMFLDRQPAAQQAPAEQVVVRVAQQVSNGQDHIQIQLDPAELGRVEVRMEVNQDGKTQVAIMAENKDTLDLLQRDARYLERALQQAGLDTDARMMDFNLSQNGEQNANDEELAQNSQGDSSGENSDASEAYAQQAELDEIETHYIDPFTGKYTINVTDGLDIKV